MNVGDYLVQHSTLPSGTALAHLLAMQSDSGLGTVFASTFSVLIDEPTLSLVQRAKREAAESVERSALREGNERDLAVLTAVPRLSLLTTGESLTISESRAGSAVVVRLGDERVTVRNNETLTF